LSSLSLVDTMFILRTNSFASAISFSASA
jgi:hypothetical protein